MEGRKLHDVCLSHDDDNSSKAMIMLLNLCNAQSRDVLSYRHHWDHLLDSLLPKFLVVHLNLVHAFL